MFFDVWATNGRVSCWIIARSSPLVLEGCLTKNCTKYQSQYVIYGELLQSSSKTCVRSVLSTQIEFMALCLNSQIFNTALWIRRYGRLFNTCGGQVVFVDAQEQGACSGDFGSQIRRPSVLPRPQKCINFMSIAVAWLSNPPIYT